MNREGTKRRLGPQVEGRGADGSVSAYELYRTSCATRRAWHRRPSIARSSAPTPLILTLSSLFAICDDVRVTLTEFDERVRHRAPASLGANEGTRFALRRRRDQEIVPARQLPGMKRARRSQVRTTIKQARDAFLARGAQDGFADQRRDRQDADVSRPPHRFRWQDRIGDHQRLQPRVLDAAHRAARKNAVSDVGHHLGGAVLQQSLGGVDQRAAEIDDVVDEDAALAAARRR